MLFSLLLRSLIPILLLLPQVSAIAAVPSSRTNLIAQAQTSSLAPAEIEKLKKEVADLKRTINEQNNLHETLTNHQKEFKEYQEKFAADQQKKLEEQQKYNSDLMNTVFFSLLGSVLTVTLAILGLQFFAQAFDRDRQQKEILESAKGDLWESFDAELSKLFTRIQWLEYQTASLSAEYLDQIGGVERFNAIQDRIRAIEALQCFNSRDLEVTEAIECITIEWQAIALLLEQSTLTLEAEYGDVNLTRLKYKICKQSIDALQEYIEAIKNIPQQQQEEIEKINELIAKFKPSN